MTAIKELEKNNKIEQSEFDNISKMLLESLQIKSDYKSVSFLNKKDELLEHFSMFLEKYLQLHFLTSPQDKLQLINFIDKLNMQRELLDLKKGKIKRSDIELAGQRLGRKAQSAFKSKSRDEA